MRPFAREVMSTPHPEKQEEEKKEEVQGVCNLWCRSIFPNPGSPSPCHLPSTVLEHGTGLYPASFDSPHVSQSLTGAGGLGAWEPPTQAMPPPKLRSCHPHPRQTGL